MVWQFAYIHEVAGISLLSRKKYKCDNIGFFFFFFSLKKVHQENLNHQNNGFYIPHTWFTMGYKTGYLKKSLIKNHATLFRVGSSSRSNTTRFHKTQQITHLETSSITNINRNPPRTIPHPCNSFSCPQARRLTEAAHNFNFSIVTLLVNMSAGFLDPQIFSSINSLSSTR